MHIAQDRLACLVLVNKNKLMMDKMKEEVGTEVLEQHQGAVGVESKDDYEFVE